MGICFGRGTRWWIWLWRACWSEFHTRVRNRAISQLDHGATQGGDFLRANSLREVSVKIMHFVFRGFSFKWRFDKASLTKLICSAERAELSETLVVDIIVSSAYRCVQTWQLSTEFVTWLMYMLKKVGLSMEPWETPLLMGSEYDRWPSTLTDCICPEQYFEPVYATLWQTDVS